MDYNMAKTGERIRQLRIKSGLTQEKVANLLNVDQSFYGRIETGKPHRGRECKCGENDNYNQISGGSGLRPGRLSRGKFTDEHQQ